MDEARERAIKGRVMGVMGRLRDDLHAGRPSRDAAAEALARLEALRAEAGMPPARRESRPP